MYEENRRFSWTNLFIKLIISVIFILFVVWLLSLSTKGLNESIDVLTDNVMRENLSEMKEVGREYFTIERLPKKVGDIEKITLQEMYDKHLLLEIKDQDGKACSANNSYVSVEKIGTEYEMKVYLECGEDSEYIISILGCTDLCDKASCEAIEEEEEEDTTPVVNPTPAKKIEYQYVLKINGHWGDYGAWSNWSKNKITASDSKQVQEKIENEAYTYTVTVTNTINYNYNVSKSCPSGYTKTSDGTRCYKTTTTTTSLPTCPSTYNGYTLTSQNGLTCNYKKTTSSYSLSFVKQTNGKYMPSDTSTYHYEKVSVQDVLNCDNSCIKETIYTYNVYKKNYKTNTSTTTSTLSCPTGYSYNSSSNKCAKSTTSYQNLIVTNTCPVGTNENANRTGCYKLVTTDEIRTGYKQVTYYRYRTRSYVEGTTTYKWSSSKNDKKLLNAGYKLTGKTRNA